MKKIQRYEWEDALIDAQRDGHLKNGAILVCLKLASNINWNPSNGRSPGLYWKNEEALKDAGVSRSAYFEHRKSILETGFMRVENKNLIPCIPEKSAVRTNESVVETNESVVRTEKSAGQHPLSEDILSEDVLSVDTFTEIEDKVNQVDKGNGSTPAKPGIPLDSPYSSNEIHSPIIRKDNVPIGNEDIGKSPQYGLLEGEQMEQDQTIRREQYVNRFGSFDRAKEMAKAKTEKAGDKKKKEKTELLDW